MIKQALTKIFLHNFEYLLDIDRLEVTVSTILQASSSDKSKFSISE